MVIATAFAVCIVLNAVSQGMELGFANVLAGTGFDIGSDIAIADNGDIVATGFFSDTVDFDPGLNVVDRTSAGDWDIYICRYDASGNLLWVQTMGGTGSDRGVEVALDSLGNILLCGYFSGTLDLNPGPGVDLFSSGGGFDHFVCKLNPSGSYIWGKSFAGSGNAQPSAMVVDATGDVLLTGNITGTVDFDPGPGTENRMGPPGSNLSIFVSKVSASGAFLWAGAMGGLGNSIGTGVDVDASGNVYTVGWFNNTVDFDPGPGTTFMTSSIASSAFLCKFDSTGVLIWAGALQGFSLSSAADVSVERGDLYCVGYFGSGSVDFDMGPGTAILSAPIQGDAFLCKLDTDGGFQWVHSIGDNRFQWGMCVDVDSGGNSYWAGTFWGTIDLDVGPGEQLVTTLGDYDLFVIKLNPVGDFVWGGTMNGNGADDIADVEADDVGNIYTAGQFLYDMDLDPGAGSYEVLSAGSRDGFFLKFEPSAPPVAIDDAGETPANELLTSLATPPSDSVLTNDTDSNTRAVLSVASFDTTSTLGATIVVNPDGTFLYDPTVVPDLQALAPGISLVDTFTYTASDGTETAVGTVVITVHGKGGSAGLPAVPSGGQVALVALLALLGTVWRRKVAEPNHTT